MESILVNLVPGGTMPTCHVAKHDVGRVIRIYLYDGPIPYILQSGDTCTISIRKSDGTVVYSQTTFESESSYVDLVTTDEMDDIVGKNLCELRIANSSRNIGSSNFYMDVADIITDINALEESEG